MALTEEAPSAARRLRDALQEEGRGTCCRCASSRPLEDVLIVYDVPLACGGTDTWSNVRIMCRRCAAGRP